MTQGFPEPTAVVDEPNPVPAPDVTDNGKPPDEPEKTRSISSRLGQNRRRGSNVRKLNKTDLEQLRGYYGTLSVGLMPFNAKAAEACAKSADQCVEAWAELAETNDSVRRALLAVLEGGAWSRVIVAHMPIMLAFTPAALLEKLPGLLGNIPDNEAEDVEE